MWKNLLAKQEMQVQALGQEDPLEEEMAAHSRILAWEIPWTEERGGLYPWGHQRVRHNLVTKEHQVNNDNSHQLATGSRKQRATPTKWSIMEGEC